MSSDITTGSDEAKVFRRNSCSSTSSRFGNKSLSMFFTRNVAHPRNLRFITGVAGSQICSIKEDQFTLPPKQSSVGSSSSSNMLADPFFSVSQPSSSSAYDQELIKSYSSKLMPKRRKERALPPLSFWASYGLVSDNTNKWKTELNQLASSVGLMTSDELKNATERLQKEKNMLPASPKRRSAHSSDQKPATSEYSKETGRLNESAKPRTSKSSRGGLKMPSYVFCVDNNEREVWMIQVLCQILQTESMQDIQSWLVSAGTQEKEVARELIQKALQGLQESGRIEIENTTNSNVQVDLNNIEDAVKRISDVQKDKTTVSEPHIVEDSAPADVPKRVTINDKRSISRSGSRSGMTPAPSSESNPLQKILAASYNFDDVTKTKPKTPSAFNDKYALFDPINEKEFRSPTGDLFRSNMDSASDKKLSNKIIKELVNFVEVDRRQNQNRSSMRTPTEKSQLFPVQKSAKTKTFSAKPVADVLTIED